MVARLRSQSREAGVSIIYEHGRKIVGDRNAKSRLFKVLVTEFKFTDDFAMSTMTRAALVSAG